MYLLKNTTLLLQQLRLLMVTVDLVMDPLAAYIVPTGDAHHSLRMADCDQRRAFLTGFDGSSGVAVITSDKALLWTDARYFIQAEEQLDENWTLMKEGIDVTLEEWLARNIPLRSYIGLDPKYYGILEWNQLNDSLANQRNITLTSVNNLNLIDMIWEERPECPKDIVKEQPLQFAGRSTRDKISDVYNEMATHNVEVLVITELDEIAWLLNLRGTDLPLAPVFNAYIILTRNSSQFDEIFIENEKISDEIKNNLRGQFNGNLTFYPYDSISSRIQFYVDSNPGKIWISKYCNAHIGSLIPTEKLKIGLTPLSLMKAVKNGIEVEGMKVAHLKDSASIVMFLSWLEVAMGNDTFIISEIEAAELLTSIKATQENYVSQSFKTISATGSNGAIIHYFPTEATNRNLSRAEMYLLDSGSHYLDGTTDITRTLHFDSPSDYQKDCYTRVLKGHVAVASSIFPYGTKGYVLDKFARRWLWEVGRDYGHGTGHGIGAYLNLAEGPHNMGFNVNEDDPGLRPNMFMSNEPGYYEKDQFGIRLENIVRIVEAPSLDGFLQLETISWVPFQQKLLKLELLTENEIAWINEYHRQCKELVGKYIEDNFSDFTYYETALLWLDEQTKHI